MQCLFYPESAAKGWLEYVLYMGCEVYISPLHDKDINSDGTVKKAHYHVVFDFKTKKSLEQFADMLKGTGAVIDMRDPEKVFYPDKHGSIVHHKSGAIRYLIHADDPAKAQYEKEDIKVGGGGDVEKYFQEDSSHKLSELNKMFETIDSLNIHYFCDFIDYCRGNEIEWINRIFEGKTAYILGEYIKSRRQKCA